MKIFLKYSPWVLTMLSWGLVLLTSCGIQDEESKENHDPAFRPVKGYYENSSGEKANTTYYYDIHGQKTLAHWQLADSSRSSVNYYEYDTSGNRTRKYREFSDGLISDQHYRFDRAGRLIREDFSRSDGVKGETDYEYDQQGRCVEARCRGLNGWFHGDLIFYHDMEGMKFAAGIHRDGDSVGFIRYGYDDYGNLIHEYWDFNGQWSQSFVYEYQQKAIRTYTPPNAFIRESGWFRVKGEHYTQDGETGGPSRYQYDTDGRLVEKEYTRSDGLSTRTTYDYDSTGILRSSSREYHDGITAAFNYWYSIDRKLLVRTFERSDGRRGSETYRYDDLGLLANAEWDQFDGWLSGMLTFHHDERGLLKSAKFEGDDGFDADLRFEYDLNQNLSAIIWEFSYGGYQKYDFTYEPL